MSTYASPRHACRACHFLALTGGFLSLLLPARAQVDMEINQEVWKQKYGVLTSQMNEQPPYAGWLSQDADGDGVNNRSEFLAGTNPFQKAPGESNFRPPTVVQTPTTLSLTFPTQPGKFYTAESSTNLVDAWSRGTLPGLSGDGTPMTLIVPKSAGNFFHIGVTDQATQGDQVSDWAKHSLGLSMAAPIQVQTSFDHSSLANKLQTQNIVSLKAADNSGTQPPDSSTPAGDFGTIRVTRSGYILLGDITVPLAKSGSAVEGVDFAALPASITFPAGVNSLDVKITPIRNSSRTTSTTVFLTAATPDAATAAGNYTLGNPASAGVTIYPANNPTGTGLTANYYQGSSTTYANPLNFGGITGTYSYTKANAGSGAAVITCSGTPAAPFGTGSQVSLQFTSSTLNVLPYNTPLSYTVIAPVTANSFAVAITALSVPANSSGIQTVLIGPFSAPVTRLDPTVDFTWGTGTPNGTSTVGADNYSVVWDAYLAPISTTNHVFQLDANDRARVSLDRNDGNGLQQILENGWDTPATGAFKQSAIFPLTAPATAADRYHIRIEYAETTGSAKCRFQWKVNTANFANIPTASIWKDTTATTANSTNNTWNAVYYANATFTPPALTAQNDGPFTNTNNGDFLTGTPDPSLFHNNFSARWTGQVLPQYSQTYYFATKADDGSKLWVNNQLVVDQWTSTSEKTGTINLQAGVLYDIRMDYNEIGGSSEAHLSWYSADQAKQVIPTNRLFPTITGIAARAGDPPAGAPAITSPTDVSVILGSGPISFPLTGSNGGTITTSGLPPWLTLVNGNLTGTPTAAGIYQFTVTTTSSSGSGSAVFTLEVLATGSQLTRELWTSGVTGPSLTDVPWTAPPTTSDTISTAGDNTTYAADTGERLRGYITAPSTGNFYFWISASNSAELWISNDSEPVNKVLRARVNGPTGTASKTWDTQSNQKSQWLSLTGGKRYYIEILHNTGSSGTGNNLAVGWFLDPTGNTASPITNGSGLIPSHALSPWDNPPTTAVPGTLYVTNLQGAPNLGNITGTGGSFLRVNGNSAVLHLNYSGLTSGAVSKKLYNSTDQVIFDLDAQDRNFPALKTSDSGYTWDLQPADLTALNNGQIRIEIATGNHPDGELTGTFGKTAGSQTAPAVPNYPALPEQNATDDAAFARFLIQTTFGPSTADMDAVKASGYRNWLENQMNGVAIPPTHNLEYLLANVGTDPGNQFGSNLLFNSWWKNSVTAPDQFRQRAAFALSEILVVSDVGPLNNNGRVLADYYDTMLDSCFGNFRDILKQVTLSPAMGVYLDMRANAAGSIITGVHPNENYAREILQLFSAGLYRVWPDGTLVLDSKGNAIPTYDQSVITGMARVFTGWSWGQPLNGDRLPSGFSPTANYLDPMVLTPSKHELGTKILLDNVILPAATVISAATGLLETSPIYTVYARATPGSALTGIDITNPYDRNGLRDLEVTLDNIINNSATGPYICRQLIQRLVTSHPKPAYLHRVVRAFNGEQNTDGFRTGVRGDMKDVFRAILLDYEARSTSAAADPQFGKQREPIMRITAPARAFPSSGITGANYRGLGFQQVTVTTTSPHRLGENEFVFLDTFADLTPGGSTLPATGSYQVKNTATTYNLTGPSNLVTINAPGYQAGDMVKLQFTSSNSGTFSSTVGLNTVLPYPVVSATPTNFVISLGTSFSGNINGNASMPHSFTFDASSLSSANYNVAGTTVTITANGYITGQPVFLKFASGGLLGAGLDKTYTVSGTTATAFTVILPSLPASLVSGKVLIPKITGGYKVTTANNVSTITFYTAGSHNLSIDDTLQIDFQITNSPNAATDGLYTVTAVDGPTVFSVSSPSVITNGTQGGSGMVGYPLVAPALARNGTLNINMNTWNIAATQNDLNQTPLNSTTVFNFFYPDYQYPGAMAKAGMTTPEFQLSNDSNTMNLTNAVTTTTIGSGNPGGFSSYKSNAITLDLSPHMTPAKTGNNGIPELVDKMGTLLTGGNLTQDARATIISYATSLPFTASAPTSGQMRDRVRAIVHLITTSAEFAIQR